MEGEGQGSIPSEHDCVLDGEGTYTQWFIECKGVFVVCVMCELHEILSKILVNFGIIFQS